MIHLLLFVAGMFVGNAAAAAVRIELKPLAVVAKRDYTLGDIASVTAEDAREANVLAAIAIGKTPRPGYTDRMTKEELRRVIRSRGIDAAAEWKGADVVRVEAAANPFSGKRIADDAAAHLSALLANAGYRAEIQPAADVADVPLPHGEVSLRPRAMNIEETLRRRVPVRMDILLDGVFYRSLNVPFLVKAYGPAWVARRDLPKGQALQCADLSEQVIDVAAFDGDVAAGKCDDGLGRLKHALAGGSPLLTANLQPVPAVTQGETITLQFVDGALALESAAVALTDGAVGQRVPVKPATSKDTVLAHVVAPGVVRISGR
ncbi:MAG TPA: flagellar basal body P-ring formation chaperone FlgA [Paucimonas sp.]|nr:flagellar basal body P-ring formation chaperone FlgA [Paucimonas sp.]